MGISKCIGFFSIFIFLPFSLFGQDTLQLNREQAETIFLKENLQLLAEKLRISQAEAMVIQAKLWPNPTLEIDEVNLWASKKQLEVFGDELQGFNNGSFGKNQQLAASLEQLIITAGKRKKLIALEEVSVEKSKQYFEDLLRNLKLEFRNQLTQLQYLQFSSQIYQQQLNSIEKLTSAYKNQVDQGHIAKGEYIRLKALQLTISKNRNGIINEINQTQKELKLLMRLPSSTNLKLTDDGYLRDLENLESISLINLLDTAKAARPDFKIAEYEESYFNKLYDYEKAQRIPDVTFKVGYDRGGNFMYNFIGFGLAIDLPIFDRNQGNIRNAEIGIEHSNLILQQKELDLENEIALAYQNLNAAIQFLSQIEPDYESTLDTLLESYTKNFGNRNMSLLEYLDFMEAYLENKEIILEAGKEVNERAEELNYTIGTDVIN